MCRLYVADAEPRVFAEAGGRPFAVGVAYIGCSIQGRAVGVSIEYALQLEALGGREEG